MAIQFHPNTSKLLNGSLFYSFGVNLYQPPASLQSIPTQITLYSGPIPYPSDIINNWALYNSSASLCLGHFPSVSLINPGGNTTIVLQSAPQMITPLRNGIASWAIMWVGSINLTQTTLSNYNFIIVDVSNSNENGIVRLVNTTLNTSTPITISNISLSAFL